MEVNAAASKSLKKKLENTHESKVNPRVHAQMLMIHSWIVSLHSFAGFRDLYIVFLKWMQMVLKNKYEATFK